jgi:hypothetical protein
MADDVTANSKISQSQEAVVICDAPTLLDQALYNAMTRSSFDPDSPNDASQAKITSFSPTSTVSPSRRRSVIDDEIKDAWMTKGWKLRQSIITHNIVVEGGDDAPDQAASESVQAAQARFQQIRDANKVLHGALISKKMMADELRTKNKEFDALLAAAQGVEDAARQMSVFDLQDEIRKEERLKQDMQLELSQTLVDGEEEATKLEARNEFIQSFNSKNKRLLREQQAEIKERQKAIRHLQRQIQVLEGASKSSQHSTVKPEGATRHSDVRCGSLTLDECDVERQMDYREKVRAKSAAMFKEEKAREQAKKAQSGTVACQSSGTPAMTIEDYKNLPGLNLGELLGSTMEP